MSLAHQPYNISLPSYSPVFTYLPYRDGDASTGWNSSYTSYSVADALNNQAAVSVGYFRGVGVPYRTTSYTGASVSLNFTGTAIYLCYVTSAPCTFSVDGVPVQTTSKLPDPACADYGSEASVLAVSTNLSWGMHEATLELTSGAVGPLSFLGAVVTIDAGSPGPKKSQIISDEDDGWKWNGEWVLETDDPYMWNGKYRAGQQYSMDTAASYTIEPGTSALILRGLSMCNYGPYSVTLDGGPPQAFNASDLYWRHSRSVLYFASGLDPTQPHTIQITNYDSNYPNATPIGPYGLLGASVNTLELIMDDVDLRDAVLASVSPPSSTLPAGTIAAAILGGVVLLLLGSNAFFVYRWQRMKKDMQYTRFAARTDEMEKDIDALPPPPTPWSVRGQASTVALLSTDATSTTSSGAATPLPAVQRPEKRPLRVVANADSVEMDHLSPPVLGYTGVTEGAQEGGASGSKTMPPADPKALGQLVDNLATILNGHLHEEYLQRERRLDNLEGPPTYRDG